jgi:hypothetical protein
MLSLLLLLTQLVEMLVLTLLEVDILSSWADRCSLWGRVTRAGIIIDLPRGLELPFLLTHLLASTLHQDGTVHHFLEILESMHHQLILDRTNQTLPKMILLLFIIGYICESIAKQLDELVLVLTHRHRPLFHRKELLLLELHQTLRYVVLPKPIPELLPGVGVGSVVGCGVSIPPICCCPFQPT